MNRELYLELRRKKKRKGLLEMRPQIGQTKLTGSGTSNDVTDEQIYSSGVVCIYKRN
jgi:hypothetical protein